MSLTWRAQRTLLGLARSADSLSSWLYDFETRSKAIARKLEPSQHQTWYEKCSGCKGIGHGREYGYDPDRGGAFNEVVPCNECNGGGLWVERRSYLDGRWNEEKPHPVVEAV